MHGNRKFSDTYGQNTNVLSCFYYGRCLDFLIWDSWHRSGFRHKPCYGLVLDSRLSFQQLEQDLCYGHPTITTTLCEQHEQTQNKMSVVSKTLCLCRSIFQPSLVISWHGLCATKHRRRLLKASALRRERAKLQLRGNREYYFWDLRL